jgi:hypothetical protein
LHEAYVTNLNAATSALITALNNGDVKIALQAAMYAPPNLFC